MRQFATIIIALIISFGHQASANSFKTEKWLTKNGVQVIFYPAMEVPMLDINLAFAAGSVYDGDHYGLSHFTTQMINQGSSGEDATAVAEALADTGSQFSAETNRDMVVFSLRTLTEIKSLQQSIQLFNQIINHPDFPDEAFAREKKQMLMAIEQNEESPDDLANINLFKSLYLQHPYAHSVKGTTATIDAINKKQLIDFYKQYFVSKNAILVMVGAIEPQKAHQIAEQITQDLSAGSAAPAIEPAIALTKAEKINIPFPSSQTVIRLGQIGIDHKNPDYFPLMVGNYILGGGSLVSRLAIEVREKRGLTYGVSSQFTPMPGNGPFIISLSTKNNQVSTALKITEDTLNKFILEGPTQQELESAKHYLTGSFPLSLGSNSAIAALLLRMAFYHLPENYLESYLARIDAVTIKEIKQAFKKQIQTEKFSLVMVGRS